MHAQTREDNERLYRSVFEYAADGILIAGRDGGFLSANPRFCEMVGYTREELMGRQIASLTAAKYLSQLEEAMDYLLRNPLGARSMEWELRRKDGSVAAVELSVRALEDGRWMAVARDIGERRRIQQALEKSMGEIRDLYDNAPCGYHSTDCEGVYLRVNRTELNWLGYEHDQLVGKKAFADLLTLSSRATYKECLVRMMAQDTCGDLELELVRRDGSVLPVLLRVAVLKKDALKPVEIRAILFDMSDMAKARAHLRQAATVFDHTNDAIIVTDAERNIIAVNRAFTRITGYRPEEAIGQTPSLLKSGRHQQEFYERLWKALEMHGTWQGDIWDCRKSGELFPAWESIAVVKDDAGRTTNYISIFSDITVIKDAEQKLTRLAYHDSLTGLANRLLFNDRMEHVLAHARRHRKRAALLLLDLDRFKLINDSLGHAAGDQLLQVVSARLKESVREEDTVARIGGDEFAIIFTSMDTADDAAIVAQKLRSAITQPVRFGQHELRISISIGISIFPDDGTSSDALYKMADMALYGAKAKGRNTYEFYTPEMTRAANETLSIDRDLRQALQLNQLALAYQPQINLRNGKVIGMEALLRWNSPLHGMQLPSVFIPVAEETELIDSIGDWVIDKALGNIEHWRRIGAAPIRVGINLSPRQFKKPGFIEELRRKLNACRLNDGFGIDIEITERIVQTESGVVEALGELKPFGLTVSIDNFGTGYSCLNTLKHLPVEVVKIDRSFIDGIPDDEDDKAITASIIAMAHELGIFVVAEGVETQEQLGFIIEHGCDRAQGFLFSEPVMEQQCDTLMLYGSGPTFSTLAPGFHRSA